MTNTTALRHVTNAPDGIVRVFAPEGTDPSKRELRNYAAKLAGTIDVGRTPAGKRGSVTLPDGAKLSGLLFDFAPVKRAPAEDAPAEVAPAEDPRAAVLRSLGLPEDAIAAALAVANDALAPAKAKSAGKGKSSFRDQVLVPRARAREAAAKRCGKCLGFGRVRSHPRDGAKFPYAFRTKSGAAKAPTGVPCDACSGSKRKTA